MVYAVAYTSKAQDQFKEVGLLALAKSSALKNAKAKISGYFFYKDEQFFQYLEGDIERVQALMARIEQDERHILERKIELGTIPERLFAKWSMRYLTPAAIGDRDTEHLFHEMLLYSTGQPFPDPVAQGQIMQLISQVAEQQYDAAIH